MSALWSAMVRASGLGLGHRVVKFGAATAEQKGGFHFALSQIQGMPL